MADGNYRASIQKVPQNTVHGCQSNNTIRKLESIKMNKFSLALTIALGLTVCYSSSAQDKAKRLPLGAIKPALDMRSLDGSAGPTWQDLRGKVVIMDFWATWCTPCIESIPHLNALKKELADQPVRLMSITYEPGAKINEFLKTRKIETEIFIDNDLSTFKSFSAWGIPIMYVFDKEGRLVAGISPKNLTADIVRQILAGETPTLKEHGGWDNPDGAAKYFRELLDEDRKKFGVN
jgi:thiol-disulfide isomerase/thioredoxin